MAGRQQQYHYSVVREVAGPAYADVALLRCTAPHGLLSQLLRHEPRDAVVLAHRAFRPMFDLAAMEAYAGQLERAAEHGNAGTLGCFVDTEQRGDAIVRVALYERWFDGKRLRCQRLAERDFDATEPDAVVASAEFLTELQAWAAECNDRREAACLEAVEEERDRARQATERATAAHQLERILASHNQPAGG